MDYKEISRIAAAYSHLSHDTLTAVFEHFLSWDAVQATVPKAEADAARSLLADLHDAVLANTDLVSAGQVKFYVDEKYVFSAFLPSNYGVADVNAACLMSQEVMHLLRGRKIVNFATRDKRRECHIQTFSTALN